MVPSYRRHGAAFEFHDGEPHVLGLYIAVESPPRDAVHLLGVAAHQPAQQVYAVCTGSSARRRRSPMCRATEPARVVVAPVPADMHIRGKACPGASASKARRVLITALVKAVLVAYRHRDALSSARRMISSASSMLMAMGFSMMTLTPRSVQASAIRAWLPLSVALRRKNRRALQKERSVIGVSLYGCIAA